MSWGGQQGYGRPGAPPQGQYGAAPPGQYGAPPAGQYGAPPAGQHGVPPAGQYGAPPAGRYGAPPQGQYGAPPAGQYGAPPAGQYGASAPPQNQYGAQSAPYGANPELWHWFQTVDADRSGKITAIELQQALLNGNWSHFNPETCRLMIGMFDKDRNGTIDFNEFSALWKYIQEWKTTFDRFDRDRSGNIDCNELQTALKSFGYNISPQMCQLMVRVFDREHRNVMKFDDFIQSCVLLANLTNKFQKRDTNRNGWVEIGYEEFLTMALDH
ncbi:unnamed protein product [Owenia fusiformis]|uniref:Uncharacterized protein n=1 Tax=Owenia fusiformis TaxID=6347 RepID=A0A8J1U4U7_OWEFU|nr:unnamed protein product [Owenia fusiformis]